jgi:hypothetical protein
VSVAESRFSFWRTINTTRTLVSRTHLRQEFPTESAPALQPKVRLKAESDYTTDNFLQWFVRERLEEVLFGTRLTISICPSAGFSVMGAFTEPSRASDQF